MKFPEQNGRLTVRELRRILDEMEESWTDEDVKYMGEFDAHNINVLFPESGVGPAKFYYHGGLDIVLLPDDEVNNG